MSGFPVTPLPGLQRLPFSGSSYDRDFFLSALQCMLNSYPRDKICPCLPTGGLSLNTTPQLLFSYHFNLGKIQGWDSLELEAVKRTLHCFPLPVLWFLSVCKQLSTRLLHKWQGALLLWVCQCSYKGQPQKCTGGLRSTWDSHSGDNRRKWSPWSPTAISVRCTWWSCQSLSVLYYSIHFLGYYGRLYLYGQCQDYTSTLWLTQNTRIYSLPLPLVVGQLPLSVQRSFILERTE